MNTNRFKLCALGFCVLVAYTTAAGQQTPPATLAELQQKLEQHIGQAKFGEALWGVKIVSAETGKTVFEHNARKLFSPASNCKLFTVGLVLDRLGPDYRVKTSLYARGKPDASGRLAGDLLLYGRGDPTINGRLHHGNILEGLEPLVRAVTNAGVREIAGDLVADDSYFHGPAVGSGWAWDDVQYDYGALISALTINDNVVEVSFKPGDQPGALCRAEVSPAGEFVVSNEVVTVNQGKARAIKLLRPANGKILCLRGELPVDDHSYREQIPIPHPAETFARLFREALALQGITVGGRERVLAPGESGVERYPPGQWVELGSVSSPPLSELAREVQKPSQNLYADLLLAHLGEASRSAGEVEERTSEELGIRELNKFLNQVGIDQRETWFEEGSGLSRDNLASPNATVQLLQFMSGRPCASIYLDSLPIAGVDGTLKNRMVGTAAAGNVHAKTGSLRWANALSGYVTTAAGERLIFSIMLNRYENLDASRATRAEIDTVPIMLAGFNRRTTE